MLHLRAHNPADIDPYCPFGCKDENGAPYRDSWIHHFLCDHEGIRDMKTARHNGSCVEVDKAFQLGAYGSVIELEHPIRQ